MFGRWSCLLQLRSTEVLASAHTSNATLVGGGLGDDGIKSLGGAFKYFLFHVGSLRSPSWPVGMEDGRWKILSIFTPTWGNDPI